MALLRRLTVLLLRLSMLGAVYALVWPQALSGPVAYLPVSGDSMDPHIEDRALAVVRRAGTFEVGDVIAYRIPDGEVGAGAVVIHRVVRIDSDGAYVTQGDNRSAEDPWRPRDDDVLGKEWFHVDGVGSLLARLRSPLPLALGAAGLAVWIVAGFGRTPGPADEAGGEPADDRAQPVGAGSKA